VERIGKYQIQAVIGRGGMGTVYEAIDPLINRKIALKTMIPGLAENPDLRARFLREAQAAGGLRHRNIVTVYDLGEDKGQPYIAMEFIEGTDLEKVIHKREPLSIEWKLDVIRQICEGLAYAHRNGIVHRDVKPANIRVTPEGEVKIMDFGIAHLQSSTMTRGGVVLGTVHYMAPEQIQGQKVDHRADIFSVGAIAYELIALRKPFDGETITAVIFKITHEKADPAALPTTDYSPGLEAIVMKALARDVKERYQGLDEMHQDLERLVRETAPKLLKRSDPVPALLLEAKNERLAGRLKEALEKAREAQRLAPQNPDGTSLVAELEKEEQLARAVRTRLEGQQLLDQGNPKGALEHAQEVLASNPGDEGASALARSAEAELLRKKVEKEMSEMRAEIEQARSAGQLQRALGLCRRLLGLNPEDREVAKVAEEIEVTIRDKEVEQLCGLALSYAADGDLDLAQKIGAKAERIGPQNPKYLKLKVYLQDETARRSAEAFTATAREHLAVGNLAEAQAAAEEALKAYPSHSAAREIRDGAARVLAVQEKARTTPVSAVREAPESPFRPPPLPRRPMRAGPLAAPQPSPAAAPGASPTPAAPEAVLPTPREVTSGALLTPLPEGTPQNPQAASLLEAARLLLKDRQIQKALVPLEQAAALEPGHPGIARVLSQTRSEVRRAEVESLSTAALNHFVQNDYPRAKKAADKLLALDPSNRKAQELLKILGALG
jgi:serine/threonine protein kinase